MDPFYRARSVGYLLCPGLALLVLRHEKDTVIQGAPEILRQVPRECEFPFVVEYGIGAYVVIRRFGAMPETSSARTSRPKAGLSYAKTWSYISVVIMVLAVTVVGKALRWPFDLINIMLLYLLPVLACAVWKGLWPSIAASLMGILAFDYFFVPPVLSFSVAHVRYLLDFALFLAVALVTGTLAARLRAEAGAAQERERRTAALYSFSQRVAGTDVDGVLRLAVQTLAASFRGDVEILLPGPPYNVLVPAVYSGEGEIVLSNAEKNVARLALERGRRMIADGQAPGEWRRLFLPITDGETNLGVLVFEQHYGEELDSEQEKDIGAFMTVTALAITRAHLAAEAEHAKWLAESEKLHRSLLNAVSHDLRTPLSSIMGAVTGLQSQGSLYDVRAKEALLETIREGAHRMNRFIANLLDMARLESGILTPNREWCDLLDVIGVALREVEDMLPEPRVKIDCPDTIPLIEADPGLIQQVLINLLENAAKYSSLDSIILVSVSAHANEIRVAVRDDAPSIPEEDRNRIFDKFYRLRSSKHLTGTGLGLSICKGLVEALGGRIWVEPSNCRGNNFIFSFPINPQTQPGLSAPESDEDRDE
jgi:two-component system, OmpR family, sensor histidine kinase KdpD